MGSSDRAAGPALSARWFAALLLLLLQACAALAPPVPHGVQLAGRLAVRVEGDASRSFSSAFELSGSAADGQMSLSSPLGTALAQARWTPGRALLTTPEGQREFRDLDELSDATLGERVPLAALIDWLQGRPWPGAAAQNVDAAGFDQLGWHVDLSQFGDALVVAARTGVKPVTVRAKLDRP